MLRRRGSLLTMETTTIVVLSLSSLLVAASGDEHVNLWLVKLRPLMTVNDHVALAESSGLISRGNVSDRLART